MNLVQAEGLLQTAQNLEAAGEKSKARQQCDAAKPLLEKARSSQSLLAAIDNPDLDINLDADYRSHLKFSDMNARYIVPYIAVDGLTTIKNLRVRPSVAVIPDYVSQNEQYVMLAKNENKEFGDRELSEIIDKFLFDYQINFKYIPL